MKSFLPLLCCLSLLTARASAEDLLSPKPAAVGLMRILLYVPGVARALDYTDVLKVHRCDASSITFETNDSHIVIHQGPYTLIGAKTELSGKKFSDGPRFFDPK
jgi:hypothetical protein